MNTNEHHKIPAMSEAETTLRLIASLPAPAGLEERIHANLRAAPPVPRLLAWPRAAGSGAGGWLRGAAAAAIVLAVAGGSWGIYARVQPGAPGHGVAAPHMVTPGTFSETGTERRPHTLTGPAIPPPAAHVVLKPAAANSPSQKNKGIGAGKPAVISPPAAK